MKRYDRYHEGYKSVTLETERFLGRPEMIAKDHLKKDDFKSRDLLKAQRKSQAFLNWLS